MRLILTASILLLALNACQIPSSVQPGTEAGASPITQTQEMLDQLSAEVILTPTEEDIIRAFDLESSEQWAQAGDLYLELAEGSIQPERSSFYLRAAVMLYYDELYTYIEPFFESLDENAILEQDQAYKEVVLAGSYYGQGKIYQSLLSLPEINEIIDYRFKALALNIRSHGILAIGKPMDSAKLRMQISQFLKTPQEQTKNQQFIWDALNRISERLIISTLQKEQEPELRGWLELNLIARRSNMLPAKMEPWIDQWYKLYGEHPAALEFATNLLEESRRIFIEPTRIAIMLPFSGRLQKVSQAIQNGFLYAYYQDPERTAEIEIINASDNPASFNLQYEQAIQNGADFVVGPISKALINMLQDRETIDVPTMTLNYADDEEIAKLNLYQFGLRPEDEAEQIADYALTQGKYHAATLVPDTDWGLRLKEAFSSRFEKLGGHIVGSEIYPSKKNDYSNAIKRLLHLVTSNQRHSIIQQVIGAPAKFDSRRRQDIDMIFIAANARQARLIKPQLKFHHAQEIPVYATSHISSSAGTVDTDRDLNEILYVDIPWLLDQQSSPDRDNIDRLWPSGSKNFSRLYAMGVDAYRMIPSLRRLMINPEERLQAGTGELAVDKYGRVHRNLLMATYRKGRPVRIQQENLSVSNLSQ